MENGDFTDEDLNIFINAYKNYTTEESDIEENANENVNINERNFK